MKPSWRWLWFALIFGIILLLALPASRSDDARIMLVKDALDPMAQLLAPHARESIQLMNPYLQGQALSGMKGLAVVYGTQADFFAQNESSGYFPLYQASVVIAVNRGKNSVHTIRGWKSMLSSDAAVLFPSYLTEMGRLSAIAMSLALGAEEGDLRPALEALVTLQKQERLNSYDEFGSEEYRHMYQPDHLERFDAVVLWDYQAKMLQRKYGDWEIVLPEEGLLTVDCGLLYGSMFKTQDKLKQAKAFLTSDQGQSQLTEAGFSAFVQRADFSGWNGSRLTYAPRFRRLVLKQKLYSPASVLERMVLQSLTILLFVISSIIILMRVPRGLYRSSSYFTLFFLFLWLLIGLLKTITFSNTLTRYLWYATYISRHAVPVGWYCMCCLNSSGRLPARNRLILLGSLGMLLTMLVFTNDLHRQVFAFPDTDPNRWNVLYTNNWGYYLSMLWSFSLSVLGIVSIFRGRYSRRQKRLLLYSAGALVLLLAYQGLYIAGVRYIMDLDIPTTVAITLLLFTLASQRERFMHASLLSLPVFMNSPYAIAVYDKAGCLHYSNTAMNMLIQKDPDFLSLQCGKWCDHAAIKAGDKRYSTHVHNMDSGCALALEDITGIVRLEHELRTAIRKLNALKRLLAQRIEETRTFTEAYEREKITRTMEQLVVNKIADLRGYLREVSGQTGVIPAMSLRQARLLLFICQHRLRFTIRSMEANLQFPAELAARYITGLGKDLSGLGLDNTVTADAHDFCKTRFLISMLEAVDHIFLYAIELEGASLILHFTANTDSLVLHAALSMEDSRQMPDGVLLPKHLIDAITQEGGQTHVESDDEGLFACIAFRYAQERYDDLV